MKFIYKTIVVSLFFHLSLFAKESKSINNLKIKINTWKLIWSDEFNYNGKPDSSIWNFEHGFVRNEEHQWYQSDNAYCKEGFLIIEARKEKIKNPNYNLQSFNWKNKREYAEYTSASINSSNKKEFLYGRIEVSARIDTAIGLWPAIWTLGVNGEWPSCGEIDIMESYPIEGIHSILANAAWGSTKRFTANWESKKVNLNHFLAIDKLWPSKFHVWRMDWDAYLIKIYLDNELINEIDLSKTINTDGINPFHQPHYILLNLALGGQNGGNPDKAKYPNRYEIDYVRVYQLE